MSTAKIISVEIIKHRNSDLLMGISDDMKGLYVHGRSYEEVESRIPGAIREILEAEGKTNVQVLPVEDSPREAMPSSFVSTHTVRKFALAA